MVLLALILFTLNFSVAQDVSNTTDTDIASDSCDNVIYESIEDKESNIASDSYNNKLSQSNDDTGFVSSSDKWDTKFEVNKTKFDTLNEKFSVYLLDEDKSPVSNVEVSFIVNGVTYHKTTNQYGFASIPIRLNDGIYKITTKFAGNNLYNPTSKTTTITVDNVKEIEEGFSNEKIQKIIDDAKQGNVILFKGKSYDNINLVVNKKLTLISNSGTTLKSGSSNPVITVEGKDSDLTTITGLNIQGKGYGILIKDSDYVVIKNNVISNSKKGIVAIGANYLNITHNTITYNSENGILLAKSNQVYIYHNTISNNDVNGIELNSIVDGVNYKKGPENVYIVNNTISHNYDDGILIKHAGDNININLNTISYNEYNGISIGDVGDNRIQSNVISHSRYGIVFIDQYIKPKNQDISYNAIFAQHNREIEAKDTPYGDGANRLEIGDNWYTDYNTLCPKIKTNNLKFSVKQIGPNQYQVQFLDSKNNVASLLPDRVMTVTTEDGQSFSVLISGGAGVFTVDSKTQGKIKATVDDSDRFNEHKSDVSTVSEPIIGKTPSYDYPSISYAQEEYGQYDESDEEEGYGYSYGSGAGDNSDGGSDDSFEGSDYYNNGTSSQKTSPSSQSHSPLAQASQSYNTQGSVSQAGASKSQSGGAGTSQSQSQSQSQSVSKQITIDDEDIYKIAGVSFIILLIILTIAFYYRDDIKEMKSKM